MRHLAPPRRALRHHLMAHRPPPPPRPGRPEAETVRTSDLILALLAVTLLGALALMASASLMARAIAP